MSLPPQTKLVKPRTKKGKRALEQRAPKLVGAGRPALPQAGIGQADGAGSNWGALELQVEDPKRALILCGNKTSQTVKEILTDIHKLKGVRREGPAARASCSAAAQADGRAGGRPAVGCTARPHHPAASRTSHKRSRPLAKAAENGASFPSLALTLL